MPTIGPTLPPSNSTKRKAETSPPTSPASPKRRRSSSSQPPSPPPRHHQQIGPAPPPADLSTLPPADASSSSDDDSDFGPALPPPNPTDTSPSNHPTITDSTSQSPPAPPKLAREEWMLLPPSADGLNSTRMDPTKLKNRKFQTGKSASTRPAANASSSNGSGGGGISAVWTETPEQKRQRLEDEVLGRKPLASADSGVGVGGGGEERARQKGKEERDREEERRAREFNERHDRGRALMDEGKWTGREKGPGREEEDDPSKRAFDREKDMKVGGGVGYKDKKEMLRKAKGMGDRFAGGSYL